LGRPVRRPSAALCGGGRVRDSSLGVGTTITATFQYGSVDRPPLGDMPATIMTLVMGSPNVHCRYRHIINFS
ncbi:MAG: histidine kinase, partial [Cloacibacillus sp.]|nr:histidine kinase [Cloacibacillus sp.]